MKLSKVLVNEIKNELIKLLKDENYGLCEEDINDGINLVNEFWIEGDDFESKLSEWNELGKVWELELESEKWDVSVEEIIDRII